MSTPCISLPVDNNTFGARVSGFLKTVLLFYWKLNMVYTNIICASSHPQKKAMACPRELRGHTTFAGTWTVRLAVAAVQKEGWSWEVVALARVGSGTNTSGFPGYSCPWPILSHLFSGMAKFSFICIAGKPWDTSYVIRTEMNCTICSI